MQNDTCYVYITTLEYPPPPPDLLGNLLVPLKSPVVPSLPEVAPGITVLNFSASFFGFLYSVTTLVCVPIQHAICFC